jgi:glutathione reductase (NADPH)
MSHHHEFDYVVIGGGSGGIASANRAASHGARVALIAAGPLGGTCVNVGCVPKKLFWNAAQLAEGAQLARSYALYGDAPEFRWPEFTQRRQEYIGRLNDRYAEGLASNGVTLFRGFGQLAGEHRVRVDGKTVLAAPHILIATGGEPIRPDLPGAELGLDSDGFFALQEQPRHVAVVGAGYIAVELAGLLQSLGSRVSLVMRRNHFLHGFDAMLREGLMEAMAAAGVTLLPKRQVSRLVRGARGMELHFADGERLQGIDTVLWAVGRRPRSRDLNLEAVGVYPDDAGYLPVDRYQNTRVEGIYAVGDVTRAPALTPVAIAAGRRLADRLFGGQPERHLDSSLTPTVIFSHPPIATVGLTECEAQERYGADNVRVYRSRFTPLLRALDRDHPQVTHMKLVTTGAEERIVGLHALGDGVEEMLQGFAVAIRMGARKRDFDDTIAIHPTSAEEFVTMR